MSKTLPPSTIRAGVQRAEVYNEGLLCFLCDESLVADVGELCTSDGVCEEKADPAFAHISQRGLFVAYELLQDDPVCADICVGPPPTTAEKRLYPMQDLLKARLSLPTGRLVVHTPNTAPWLNEDEEIEDQPAVMEVPPGDYVLTVAHIDFDEMERRHGDEFEWDGPAQWLVLTPVSEHPPLKKSWHMLPYPVREVRALRRWSVEGERVTGELIRGSLFGISPVITNVREDVAHQAGWTLGSVRELKIGRQVYHLLYAGADDLDVARAVFAPSLDELFRRYPNLYGGGFIPVKRSAVPLLAIYRLRQDQTSDLATEGAKLQFGPEIESVPPADHVPTAATATRIENGVRATVLAVGSHVVVVDCTLEDLPKGIGEDVWLSWTGGTRRMRISADYSAALLEVTNFATAPATRHAPERAVLEKKLKQITTKWVNTLEQPAANELQAQMEELRGQIKELRIPDEVHEKGVPMVAFACRHWREDRQVVQLRAMVYGRGVDIPVSPSGTLSVLADQG